MACRLCLRRTSEDPPKPELSYCVSLRLVLYFMASGLVIQGFFENLFNSADYRVSNLEANEPFKSVIRSGALMILTRFWDLLEYMH